MEFNCKISSKEVSLKNLDSKNVYQELLNSKIVVNYSKEFYSRMYNLQADQWPDIYSLSRKVSLDTALCEFQYKILHRYLAVNVLLVKYKIHTNFLCTFCPETDETISHLFYNCVISYGFWTEFQQWLLHTCNMIFDFDFNMLFLTVRWVSFMWCLLGDCATTVSFIIVLSAICLCFVLFFMFMFCSVFFILRWYVLYFMEINDIKKKFSMQKLIQS